MPNSYDIIIIGGGITGLTLASALAEETPLSIAILEAKTAATWSSTYYDHRISAINLASQRIFQSLQIWKDIKAKRANPFTQMMIWDSEDGYLHFDCADIDVPTLGYIIENSAMQTTLEAKVREKVDWLAPVILSDYQLSDTNASLILQDGRRITAQLLVGADGAHSWLRQKANIPLSVTPYEEEAIVCTVRTALPHGHVARQVFLASGPLAFLPLANDYESSIVWSLPTRLAKEYQTYDEAHFKEILAQAFSHRLGHIDACYKRYLFPLHKQQAQKYVAPRVALIGDAAHTMHPLAGQGVNLGLLDACSLAEIITEAWRAQQNFTAHSVLRRYERWRRADNASLLFGVDAIRALFKSNQPIMRRLRTVGLNQLNHSQILKKFLSSYAVGNRSNLPKLASKGYTPPT